MQRAKRQIADAGRKLTSLIETVFALVVAKPQKTGQGRVAIPVSQAKGGVRPRVCLNRTADLEDLMEEPWFSRS